MSLRSACATAGIVAVVLVVQLYSGARGGIFRHGIAG